MTMQNFTVLELVTGATIGAGHRALGHIQKHAGMLVPGLHGRIGTMGWQVAGFQFDHGQFWSAHKFAG